jgi:hypothetical protein
MDAAVGANAKALPECDYGSIHVAEIHWYEAAGIGRKEFRIKHLL